MVIKVSLVRLPKAPLTQPQDPTVRNVHNWVDLKITIDDFIKRLRETPAYASADGKPVQSYSLRGEQRTYFFSRT